MISWNPGMIYPYLEKEKKVYYFKNFVKITVVWKFCQVYSYLLYTRISKLHGERNIYLYKDPCLMTLFFQNP